VELEASAIQKAAGLRGLRPALQGMLSRGLVRWDALKHTPTTALLEVEAEAEDAGGRGIKDEQIVGGGDYDFANGGGTCAGNPC